MVRNIVTYNNRIFNTPMVFLNHIHAIVTFNTIKNTKKGTMGQFGPMVLKYMINFHNKNQTNVLVKDEYIYEYI